MSSIYFVKELWKYKAVCDVINDYNIIEELYAAGGFQKDSFRMVGIFLTKYDDVVYCCPKYLSDKLLKNANNGNDESISELKNHMSLIVKVLDKLRADNKNIDEISYDFSIFSVNVTKRRINRYNLAKAIVTDYLEHGIYFRNEKEVKQSGRGKVRWGLTMRKLEPIVSSGEVFYPRLLRQSDYKNYETEITEIHGNVVLQCIKYLQALGEETTIEKPEISFEMKPSEMHKWTPYIKQCMLSSYTNREILLFKAMISWCDESPFYKGMGCTTCFQNVWEWVNDSVWGTKQKESLKSSQPDYYLEDNSYYGGGDAEPDTLAFVEQDTEKYITLFDSKYYVPKIQIQKEKSYIPGLPENREIVKQVAYLNDIKISCGDDIHYSNIFLLPECEQYNIVLERKNNDENKVQLWKMIGLSSKGNFDGLCNVLKIQGNNSTKKRDYVGVALVSPVKLYEQYLNKGQLNPEEIIKISIEYAELVKARSNILENEKLSFQGK